MSVFLSTVTATPCLTLHVQALHNEPEDYLSGLRAQLRNGDSFKSLPGSQISLVAAATLITGHHKDFDSVLSRCSIVEIQKLLTLVSRPSQRRQLLAKIAKIENANPHLAKTSNEPEEEIQTDNKQNRKRKRSKIDALRSKLASVEKELDQLYIHEKRQSSEPLPCKEAHNDSAVCEMIQSSSCSGSLARKIRKWARTLRPDYLEFVMLEMPNTPWQNVADVVHFRPQDFSVPYFLADVYGESIPEDSFVFVMRRLHGASSGQEHELYVDAASRFPQVYEAYASLRLKTFIRKSPQIVEDLAKNMPLDTLVWYFEELQQVSRSTGAILAERLKGPEAFAQILHEKSKLKAFGKLLERVLMFQRNGHDDVASHWTEVASDRLEKMVQQFQGARAQGKRIAVFGDASSSMQRAIEVSTIFSSMASAGLDGELSFFASGLIQSPHTKPSTVQETLEICQKVRAGGCTSLAAALWPYFDQQILVDAIVLVTDEWENTKCNGYSFAGLLKQYKEKVNPEVALVIICVGSGDKTFRGSLVHHEIEAKTVTIDAGRPDLTKFDALLAQVAAAAGVNVGNVGSEPDDFVVVGNIQ